MKGRINSSFFKGKGKKSAKFISLRVARKSNAGFHSRQMDDKFNNIPEMGEKMDQWELCYMIRN